MFAVQQVLYVVDLFCCPKHAAFSWIAGLISSLTMRQLIDHIIHAAATLSGCWSGRPYDLTYWYTYVEVSSLGVNCCLGSLLMLTPRLGGKKVALAYEAAKATNLNFKELHIAQSSC